MKSLINNKSEKPSKFNNCKTYNSTRKNKFKNRYKIDLIDYYKDLRNFQTPIRPCRLLKNNNKK